MFKYKWQMLSGSRIQLDRIYENKVEHSRSEILQVRN